MGTDQEANWTRHRTLNNILKWYLSRNISGKNHLSQNKISKRHLCRNKVEKKVFLRKLSWKEHPSENKLEDVWANEVLSLLSSSSIIAQPGSFFLLVMMVVRNCACFLFSLLIPSLFSSTWSPDLIWYVWFLPCHTKLCFGNLPLVYPGWELLRSYKCMTVLTMLNLLSICAS